MSYADQIFVRMCKDIIDNGTSTEGEKVRRGKPIRSLQRISGADP